MDACELVSDFKNLPDGDKTVVGEKGISLSGAKRHVFRWPEVSMPELISIFWMTFFPLLMHMWGRTSSGKC